MTTLVVGWQAGSAEPSVAASLQALLHNDAAAPEELAAVLREKVFVLLGGTSELGPYLSLVKLGATVVVVKQPPPIQCASFPSNNPQAFRASVFETWPAGCFRSPAAGPSSRH